MLVGQDASPCTAAAWPPSLGARTPALPQGAVAHREHGGLGTLDFRAPRLPSCVTCRFLSLGLSFPASPAAHGSVTCCAKCERPHQGDGKTRKSVH